MQFEPAISGVVSEVTLMLDEKQLPRHEWSVTVSSSELPGSAVTVTVPFVGSADTLIAPSAAAGASINAPKPRNAGIVRGGARYFMRLLGLEVDGRVLR